MKHYGRAFEGYRRDRQWYICVELWAAAVTGVLGGVMPDDGASCEHLLIAVCTVNCVQLLLVCALQPHNTRLELCVAVASNAAGAVWGAAVLSDANRAAQVISAMQVYLGLLSLLTLLLTTVFSGRAHRAASRAASLVTRRWDEPVLSTSRRLFLGSRGVGESRLPASPALPATEKMVGDLPGSFLGYRGLSHKARSHQLKGARAVAPNPLSRLACKLSDCEVATLAAPASPEAVAQNLLHVIILATRVENNETQGAASFPFPYFERA